MRGILRQPVGFPLILVQPRLLPVEIGEALLGRFELACQGRHTVALRGGIVAPVRELLARLPPAAAAAVACAFLRLVHGGLGFRHCPFRRLGLLAGLLRRRRSVAPPREQQARFGLLDLVGQRLVAFRLPCLSPQAGDLRVEPGHEVVEPGQIGFRLPELAFRIAPADMQSGDAGRFFQHLPPLRGARGDHGGDAALADQVAGL